MLSSGTECWKESFVPLPIVSPDVQYEVTRVELKWGSSSVECVLSVGLLGKSIKFYVLKFCLR